MLKRIIDVVANKEATDVVKYAKQRIRDRLAQREVISAQSLLDQCQLDTESVIGARVLLSRLGEALQIAPGTLRPSDKFSEVFRVPHSDLGGAASSVLTRYRYPDPIEPFSYDVLYVVDTTSTKAKWEKQRVTLTSPPNNEDEWLDLIMAMSLQDFLRFFGPMAKT
jgi:hypothetical protein